MRGLLSSLIDNFAGVHEVFRINGQFESSHEFNSSVIELLTEQCELSTANAMFTGASTSQTKGVSIKI